MTSMTLNTRRKMHLDQLFANAHDLVISILEHREHRSKKTRMERDRVKEYIKSLAQIRHASAEAYSKIWQLGFARNVLRMLPQELRDQVYRDLIAVHHPDEKAEIELRNFIPEPAFKWRGYKAEDNELIKAVDYPHFFQVSFMGAEFVQEVAAVFYSQKRFVLRHLGELDGFLSTDRFQCGLAPLDHVRDLVIDISLDSFKVETGHRRRWRSPKFSTPLQQHFIAATKGLDTLRQTKFKKTMSRTIQLRVQGHHDKFAEALFPTVYDLQRQGWTVHVEGLWVKSEEKAKLAAEVFNYNVPRSHWELKAKDNSAFAGDDIAGATKRKR